jgi:hypothetical protein
MVSDSDTDIATQQSIKAYVDESVLGYVKLAGDEMTGGLKINSTLEVTSTTKLGNDLQIMGNNYVSFTDNPYETYIKANDDNVIAIGTDSEDRLVIDAEGNVGLGVASPAERLDVDGNVKIAGDIQFNGDSIRWMTGSGAPDGNVVAGVGSLYTDNTANPGATILWIKESGSGSTGWSPNARPDAMFVETFGGDGVNTDFILNNTPPSINNTQVYLSGVYQQKGISYTLVDDNTIRFGEAPAKDFTVEVVIASSVTYETLSAEAADRQKLIDRVATLESRLAALEAKDT